MATRFGHGTSGGTSDWANAAARTSEVQYAPRKKLRIVALDIAGCLRCDDRNSADHIVNHAAAFGNGRSSWSWPEVAD
jgi:hypothetical protein